MREEFFVIIVDDVSREYTEDEMRGFLEAVRKADDAFRTAVTDAAKAMTRAAAILVKAMNAAELKYEGESRTTCSEKTWPRTYTRVPYSHIPPRMMVCTKKRQRRRIKRTRGRRRQ